MVISSLPCRKDCPHVLAPAGAKPALRILLLNLMPMKEETELQLLRVLGASPLCVELLPMKIAGQTYKHTPQEHMDRYYKDFEFFQERGNYDGMIVTGAPLEYVAFEDVRYWNQLCHIMDWASEHVRSTYYLCWAAFAALYHRFGIPMRLLPEKCFGIFPQKVHDEKSPLFSSLMPSFPCPCSRHTQLLPGDLHTAAATPKGKSHALRLLASSPESGVAVAMSDKGGSIYMLGHLEYDRDTLLSEYLRDVGKGLPIAPPAHYFQEDDPARQPVFSWRRAATTFYHNWMSHYCLP